MTIADELERLHSLYDRGVLSETEYTQAKARVLAGTAEFGAHPAQLHSFRRSQTDRMLGGVCGGLARYTGLPSWSWRIGFCLSVICFGFGILLYCLMWLFVPEAEAAT